MNEPATLRLAYLPRVEASSSAVQRGGACLSHPPCVDGATMPLVAKGRRQHSTAEPVLGSLWWDRLAWSLPCTNRG